MVTERMARESEAFRRAQVEATDTIQLEDEDLYSDDVITSKVAPELTRQDPQWINAWKLYIDREGKEYGVPVLLPRGQWDVGGPNSLINAKRPDGAYAFTLVEPPRLEPIPRIECFVGNCLKRVDTRIQLVEHVKAFHADESVAYETVLAAIQQQAIRDDPRLQAVLATLEEYDNPAMMAEVPAVVEAAAYNEQLAELGGEEVFRCTGGDGCRRFFDSAAGLQLHMRREHKETPHGS